MTVPGLARSTTGAAWRLLLFWALCTGPAAAAYLCKQPADAAPAVVERVIDGDTVVLAGGERVRLIGLDAPEAGRRGTPAEAYAREAAQLLEVLIRESGNRVLLFPGEEPRDAHGRLLARVFTPRRGDLAGHLLLQGYAYAVAIGPNTDGARCHFTLERRARAAERGLWKNPAARITPAARVTHTGFAIIEGKVAETRQRENDVLLQLDESLFVRVLHGVLDQEPRSLHKLRIEVRGWVHPWAGDTRAVTVSHPAMIQVMQPDHGG